jgi:hypothetical protein
MDVLLRGENANRGVCRAGNACLQWLFALAKAHTKLCVRTFSIRIFSIQ